MLDSRKPYSTVPTATTSAGTPLRKGTILETIGRTPVVRLNRINRTDVEVYAKLEAFNPLGSIKDRMALAMIEAAEADGSLRPGQTVVEASSGNTGLALAMVCAAKGYPLVIVMAENFSVERRRLMRFLGAQVVLTPASAKGSGMVRKARELAEAHGWFLCDQFSNPANLAAHEATTATEIAAAFADTGLDFFISGFGTGGTMAGVARGLKSHLPETRIVAVEPDNAPMMASGVAQPDGDESHPMFRPHPMQGWSPDFLSDLVRQAVADGLIDRVEPVNGARAMDMAFDLARQEGILCGITGGATVAAALQIAEQARPGSRILAMVPDTGERYLSTPLFDAVPSDMTEHELALSRSTPGYCFGASDAPAPANPICTAAQARGDAADVEAFLQGTIHGDEPITMFALEWCEFCWSVRNLLKDAGLPYRAVDLDAADFVGGKEFASRIRLALRERTGSATIPQIFVGGDHIGGATDLLDCVDSGKLERVLARLGHELKVPGGRSAYSYLPKWLHPR